MFRGMARARTGPRQGSRPPLPPRGASAGSFEAPLRWAPWAIFAGGAVVFQGALRYFFGQDDFNASANAN